MKEGSILPFSLRRLPETVSHSNTIADIELAWVANRRLGLSEGPCLPEQLASVTIITNPEPSHLFATTNEWFRRAGVRPSRLATCSSLLHIERLACSGVGAAILPLAILQDEFMNGSLSTIDTMPAGDPHKLFIARRHAAASLVSDLVDEIAREVLAASALAQPPRSSVDQPERPRITASGALTGSHAVTDGVNAVHEQIAHA